MNQRYKQRAGKEQTKSKQRAGKEQAKSTQRASKEHFAFSLRPLCFLFATTLLLLGGLWLRLWFIFGSSLVDFGSSLLDFVMFLGPNRNPCACGPRFQPTYESDSAEGDAESVNSTHHNTESSRAPIIKGTTDAPTAIWRLE